MSNKDGANGGGGTIPVLTSFVFGRLTRRDEGRFWLLLTMALALVGAAALLYDSWVHLGGVQNDTAQFLSWMGRWDDPVPLQNDLMAEYWSSVSPWFFTLVYKLAWLAGIPPVIFAKILPALLTPIAVLFAFRFARAIGAEPLVACVSAVATLYYLNNTDSIASAVPRAFWPVFLLVILDGLARRSIVQTALGQLLLASTYPQMALVSSGVIGLTLFDPSRRGIDLTRRNLLIVSISAVATVAGMLPFLLQSGNFAPTVTLTEARGMATFQANGRSPLFQADGSIDFLCGRRVGFHFCASRTKKTFWYWTLLGAAGAAVLLVRAWSQRPSTVERMRSPLPFYFLLSSVAIFLLAAAVLFRLHLPSRYSKWLPLLMFLVTAPLVAEWLRKLRFPDWFRSNYHVRNVVVVCFFGAIAGSVVALGDVRDEFIAPADRKLITAIRASPRDTVVAGFSTTLDFSPLLTNRSTLFNRKQAIPYQLGYFRPIMQRITDMRDVVLTHDPAVLADRLSRNKVTLFVVPRSVLGTPRIPGEFRGLFGPELPAQEKAAAAGQTALARLTPLCRSTSRTKDIAIDAKCLVREAARKQ